MVPPGDDQRQALAAKMLEKDDPQANGEVHSTGGEKKPQPLPDVEPAMPTDPGETKTTKSGVKYTTVKPGAGATAKLGQTVTVHYVGTLDDGREFDSSRKRDKPADFPIGIGQVIRGWDEGVPGMRIGEVRKLDVPAGAGYGALGKAPAIPPNAQLHFEIELVNVK
jgi:FKBP-type peptidyl-prolyl cis-trans isomerase